MQLTKTNFIQHLNCPKSLWLLKHKPEEYPSGEFSLFLQKLIDEGYEVEEYAKKLFSGGVELPDFGSPTETKEAIDDSSKDVLFQASFETENRVFARVDILQRLSDGTFHVYEVKSSTEVKRKKKHNHVKDACFQKYVIEESGYIVSKISIIHLNKEYVRKGEVDPRELLKIEDVTEEAEDLFDVVVAEIQNARAVLDKKDLSLVTCSCREKTRSNHCDSFAYFNKEIAEGSIYHIGRITEKKLLKLVDEGLLDMVSIDDVNDLNDKQQLQVQSVKLKKPVIQYQDIKNSLDNLTFPLHFIDYETYASAIPRIDNVKPHQQIPFQVSIHTMQEDGHIEHFEFLAESFELPEKLIEYMEEKTGMTGTFISWHASFEKGRNKEMMEMYPQHVEYLKYMNENMFDLKEIFSKGYYVDHRTKGSNSIKNVLPVIAPELSYKYLKIQNGTMALDTWGRMVLDPDFDENREEVRKDLLEYCKLDTWAMVEIYRFLNEL